MKNTPSYTAASLFLGGLLLITSPGYAVNNAEFGFNTRTPPPSEHYLVVDVFADPGTRGNSQGAGYNVYWKVKGSDANKGRKEVRTNNNGDYKFLRSIFEPNFPASGCNFYSDSACHYKNSSYPKNNDLSYQDQNIEALFRYSIQVSNAPNPVLGETLNSDFYRHRFPEATLANFRSSSTTWGPEDNEVSLSGYFFVESHDTCRNAGEYCGGDSSTKQSGPIKPLRTQEIFIPSNNLEFLVIEVFGFEYNDVVMDRKDYFYDMPVAVIKFTPAPTKTQPFRMLARLTPELKSDPNERYPDGTPGFNGFSNFVDGTGYLDFNISNIIYHPDNSETTETRTFKEWGDGRYFDFGQTDRISVRTYQGNDVPSWGEDGWRVYVEQSILNCADQSKLCPYPRQPVPSIPVE